MQTFHEYTEQRIEDIKTLSNYFPEAFSNDVSTLRLSYGYESSLCEVKDKLETILGREITWLECDEFQKLITLRYIVPTNKDRIKRTLEEKLNINENTIIDPEMSKEMFILENVLVRKYFHEYIGIEWGEELQQMYIDAMNGHYFKDNPK